MELYFEDEILKVDETKEDRVDANNKAWSLAHKKVEEVTDVTLQLQ